MGGMQRSELSTNNNFKDQAHDNSISTLIRVTQLHSLSATCFIWIVYQKLVDNSMSRPPFVLHGYFICKYACKVKIKGILNTVTVSITTACVQVSDKQLINPHTIL